MSLATEQVGQTVRTFNLGLELAQSFSRDFTPNWMPTILEA